MTTISILVNLHEIKDYINIYTQIIKYTIEYYSILVNNNYKKIFFIKK